MTGIIEFAGIWKTQGQVFGAPACYAFNVYSNAAVSRPVATRTQGETYSVHQGDRRLPEIPDIPYLDAVAALSESGSTLTLFCVNRHLTQDIRARISVRGFSPAHEAAVTSLYSDSIYDQNDAASPKRIYPRELRLTVPNGQLEYTFRHASVTEIQFFRH